MVGGKRMKKESPKCPIDPVRMAWPFKTDAEREVLRKWYAQVERFEKKQRQEVLERAERAFL